MYQVNVDKTYFHAVVNCGGWSQEIFHTRFEMLKRMYSIAVSNKRTSLFDFDSVSIGNKIPTSSELIFFECTENETNHTEKK